MVKKLTEKQGSKLAVTQRNNREKTKKPRGKGVPFKKRDPVTGKIDDRINTKGRPRVFDELRSMMLGIFNEEVELKMGDKPVKMSQIEAMLRAWLYSQDYSKQSKALEYGFGKVPDELNVHSSEAEDFVKANLDLFTDGQLSRLGTGEKPWAIIAELLRDTVQSKKKQTESINES